MKSAAPKACRHIGTKTRLRIFGEVDVVLLAATEAHAAACNAVRNGKVERSWTARNHVASRS